MDIKFCKMRIIPFLEFVRILAEEKVMELDRRRNNAIEHLQEDLLSLEEQFVPNFA